MRERVAWTVDRKRVLLLADDDFCAQSLRRRSYRIEYKGTERNWDSWATKKTRLPSPSSVKQPLGPRRVTDDSLDASQGPAVGRRLPADTARIKVAYSPHLPGHIPLHLKPDSRHCVTCTWTLT
jgi:hypothetical protein